MLVVDLMHEFELGVWKALFIHLLRMLNAADKALVHELDRRYASFHSNKIQALHMTVCSSFRQMPTFGRDTIRLDFQIMS